MRVQRPIPLVPVLADVLAHRVEEHALKEHARLRRLHLRDEDARRGVRGLWRPALGPGEREDARPGGQGGNDFERLRERAGGVFGEEEADSGDGRLGWVGRKGQKRTWCRPLRLLG